MCVYRQLNISTAINLPVRKPGILAKLGTLLHVFKYSTQRKGRGHMPLGHKGNPGTKEMKNIWFRVFGAWVEGMTPPRVCLCKTQWPLPTNQPSVKWPRNANEFHAVILRWSHPVTDGSLASSGDSLLPERPALERTAHREGHQVREKGLRGCI